MNVLQQLLQQSIIHQTTLSIPSARSDLSGRKAKRWIRILDAIQRMLHEHAGRAHFRDVQANSRDTCSQITCARVAEGLVEHRSFRGWRWSAREAQ
jgi:hypothetical protein